MFNQEILATKIAQAEMALQNQEMIARTLKEAILEMKEQSMYFQVLEELRQIRKAVGIQKMEYPDEFALLKEEVESQNWPLAVEQGVIVEGEAEKQHKAENIIQFVIVDYLKDLKFLDFGCGEGHTIFAANKQNTTKSIGYDLREYGWDRFRFEQNENCYLTTDWKKVEENKYDVILMFDLLDHAEAEDATQLLKKARDVLAPEGKLYIKCHPWCCRHGNHLNELGVNKAFAHLVFDEVELTRLFGKTGKYTLPITHPCQTYKDWFKETSWEVESEYISRTKIEPFFIKEEIKNRLAKHYPGEEDDFHKYISIDAIDYVLNMKPYAIF